MGLFNFGKKKEKEISCCCGGDYTSETMEQAEQKKQEDGIKVLGGGCAKCHELLENTQKALRELDMNEEVELITDFAIIATYGVMSTPAFVIKNKVVSYGKVLKVSEIKELLSRC